VGVDFNSDHMLSPGNSACKPFFWFGLRIEAIGPHGHENDAPLLTSRRIAAPSPASGDQKMVVFSSNYFCRLRGWVFWSNLFL
jgi:hypothetical protein